MKYLKSIVISSAATVMMLGIVNISYSDYTSNWQSANNACFPRQLNQIDRFNISSGSLRNTNASGRTIVCSVTFSADDNATGGVTRFPLSARLIGISAGALSEQMDCTVFSRDHDNGTLLEARALTLVAGDNFESTETGGNIPIVNLYTRGNVYIQCVVPGNGRVYGVTAFFEDTANPS